MSTVKLDWSSAEVRDGELEVPLRGELPNGWDDSFERTVSLLGARRWGNVKLKKGRVRVREVAEGDESRVHHFLESVVLQANAAHEETETEAPEDPDAHEDEPEGLDAEMTERFRSFAADAQAGTDR
jgi:hypothetical protein